jgi:bacterioferritin-associated ferredoxin
MDEDFEAIELFNQWRAGEPKDLISDDILICECFCISALDIRNLFKDAKIVDLEILKEQYCMGQACSSCLKSSDDWTTRIF